MDPKALGLPFKSFRPWQVRAIKALGGSRKKVLMYQGPVGSGKSGTALALASMLGSTTAVLTTDLGLQNQFRTDYDMVEMRKRSHFPCLIIIATAAVVVASVVGEGCGRPKADGRGWVA